MRELTKLTVSENSEVTVKQEEVDGKKMIIVEVAPIGRFKRGDIVAQFNEYFIFKSYQTSCYAHIYVGICNDVVSELKGFTLYDDARLATEEEKRHLFDVLKKQGKRWNVDTLQIEDIPEKLKKGDLVIGIYGTKNELCLIGEYGGIISTSLNPLTRKYRVSGITCNNCLKWDGTIEQFNKIRNGE